jgi:hypothetical protein
LNVRQAINATTHGAGSLSEEQSYKKVQSANDNKAGVQLSVTSEDNWVFE